MKTVVYADVYFVLNFSIDLICLAICGAIAGKPRKKKRLIIASVIGGIYACAALLITYPFLSAASAIIICLLMYTVAYSPRSLAASIYGGILLFSVNALFGGFYSAIVSVASGGRVDTERFRYYPLFLTVIAVMIFMRLINFRSVNAGVSVKIKYGERIAAYNCVVDTANSLREPISGVGVALIAREAALRLFSDEETRMLIGETALWEAYPRGFRYVLISTATGSKKCVCVKADSAFVYQGTKKTEVSLYLTVVPELCLGDAECLLPNSLNLDL